MENISKNKIRASVLENYKRVAVKNKGLENSQSECCGHSNSNSQSPCCSSSDSNIFDSISDKLGYSSDEYKNVPEGSIMGLGCGNPLAIASLKKGETVLDLGSGGGFDCFLASKSVGETGKVIGVDMTPEMISLARNNAEKGAFKNTEFRLGEIEHLPVANATIDVIISNCVINLSPEKEQVFEEAFRALKPGGKLAISDVVLVAEFPEEIKNDESLYARCVRGAATVEKIESSLNRSGFTDINIKLKHKSKEFIKDWVPGSGIENYILTATIEAVKKCN